MGIDNANRAALGRLISHCMNGMQIAIVVMYCILISLDGILILSSVRYVYSITLIKMCPRYVMVQRIMYLLTAGNTGGSICS